MRKLLARTSGSLKNAASAAAAHMLLAFGRAENDHKHPHAHHKEPHDRRRRRLFGQRRRRAIDRAWGLHDLILSAFGRVRKSIGTHPAASPPHHEPG